MCASCSIHYLGGSPPPSLTCPPSLFIHKFRVCSTSICIWSTLELRISIFSTTLLLPRRLFCNLFSTESRDDDSAHYIEVTKNGPCSLINIILQSVEMRNWSQTLLLWSLTRPVSLTFSQCTYNIHWLYIFHLYFVLHRQRTRGGRRRWL